MSEQVHISSLVAQVRPQQLESVRARCAAMACVEVHAADERGVLVLVLETRGRREVVEIIDRLRADPSVLNVNMVYHHVESAEELDQEMVQ